MVERWVHDTRIAVRERALREGTMKERDLPGGEVPPCAPTSNVIQITQKTRTSRKKPAATNPAPVTLGLTQMAAAVRAMAGPRRRHPRTRGGSGTQAERRLKRLACLVAEIAATFATGARFSLLSGRNTSGNLFFVRLFRYYSSPNRLRIWCFSLRVRASARHDHSSMSMASRPGCSRFFRTSVGIGRWSSRPTVSRPCLVT